MIVFSLSSPTSARRPVTAGTHRMIRTSRSLLTVAALLLTAAALPAQEPIKFARCPDISPDGKLIAFSYLGDVWVVETIGGVARPVTMHEAHDTNPVFS